MEHLDSNGRIPTYKVQNEFDLLSSLPDSKPSKRIVTTKKGLKAIKALIELEEKNNYSWYKYLKCRNEKNMDDDALFYRGNKISFSKMFERADMVAKSMASLGLVEGDEIGVCVSNTPELVYIILAANKLGLKVNLFGSNYDKNYLSSIMDDISPKLLFISDDNYNNLRSLLSEKKYENVVISSLADSLPKNPNSCDEYEPELDKYYRYKNNTEIIKKEILNSMSFKEFVNKGMHYSGDVHECGNLESDFLVTYTSGSTKTGFPKSIIHKNRSLITIGRFHDPELCGNPKIPGLRGLAHIHPDSNTDVITCISDNLIQGWSVALEPEYDAKKALDYIFINKPNYLNATTSFLLEVSKQYLIDRKYHSDGKGRKLPFLLATFAVGEGTQKGEEKFINKFLREARAGSGVSVKGMKLPFTTLSVGGGDCEHGGIYYTLWKSLFQKLNYFQLRGSEIGLLPVPYAVVTTLKKDSKGNYSECDYNEPGIIVANSFSNLSCYKGLEKETNDLIIKDNLGRKWVSCNTYGYIDNVGGVHVKGRIPNNKNIPCNNCEIDEIVSLDTKNILTCVTVDVYDYKVLNIQIQPFSKKGMSSVINSVIQRLKKYFSDEVIDKLYIRIIPARESFPLTAAGKRSIHSLEQMEFENTDKVTEIIEKSEKNKNDSKVKKLKR